MLIVNELLVGYEFFHPPTHFYALVYDCYHRRFKYSLMSKEKTDMCLLNGGRKFYSSVTRKFVFVSIFNYNDNFIACKSFTRI